MSRFVNFLRDTGDLLLVVGFMLSMCLYQSVLLWDDYANGVNTIIHFTFDGNSFDPTRDTIYNENEWDDLPSVSLCVPWFRLLKNETYISSIIHDVTLSDGSLPSETLAAFRIIQDLSVARKISLQELANNMTLQNFYSRIRIRFSRETTLDRLEPNLILLNDQGKCWTWFSRLTHKFVGQASPLWDSLKTTDDKDEYSQLVNEFTNSSSQIFALPDLQIMEIIFGNMWFFNPPEQALNRSARDDPFTSLYKWTGTSVAIIHSPYHYPTWTYTGAAGRKDQITVPLTYDGQVHDMEFKSIAIFHQEGVSQRVKKARVKRKEHAQDSILPSFDKKFKTFISFDHCVQSATANFYSLEMKRVANLTSDCLLLSAGTIYPVEPTLGKSFIIPESVSWLPLCPFDTVVNSTKVQRRIRRSKCPHDETQLMFEVTQKRCADEGKVIIPNPTTNTLYLKPSAQPSIRITYSTVMSLTQLLAQISGLIGMWFGISLMNFYTSGRVGMQTLGGRLWRRLKRSYAPPCYRTNLVHNSNSVSCETTVSQTVVLVNQRNILNSPRYVTRFPISDQDGEAYSALDHSNWPRSISADSNRF